MAGSLKHVLNDDGTYRGTGLLENMGDMAEAVEEMAFVILHLQGRWAGSRLVQEAVERYYRCARGEEPWPDFMQNREEV
jgi:hypothetical protein